jgi:hypothetical protein
LFSITSGPSKSRFHSVSFQNFGLLGFASTDELGFRASLECSRFRPPGRSNEGGNLREGLYYRSEM